MKKFSETEKLETSTPTVRPTKRSRFRRQEKGATAVEYALMVGLIAVGIISAVSSLRDKTSATFNNVGGAISGATPASVHYESVTGVHGVGGVVIPAVYYKAGGVLPGSVQNATSASEASTAFVADSWSYFSGGAGGNCNVFVCFKVK
jgi:pilus assembly protein Flp/PilA